MTALPLALEWAPMARVMAGVGRCLICDGVCFAKWSHPKIESTANSGSCPDETRATRPLPQGRHCRRVVQGLRPGASAAASGHREPVTLQHLAQWPIITYPSSSKPYQAVRAMLLQHGVRSPRMYASASLSMSVRMTLDGIGTSVIAPVFLHQELAEGRLRLIKVSAPELPELAFTATWRHGTDSHLAAAIARLAVQIAAGEPSPESELGQGGDSSDLSASN
jgi:hypothetical protein